ncbi:protein kinase family protein [Kitasatospora sp. NPDC049258]|uniref:protein kinase family protein n=1 Tax=Kitasatospora sp. NPDC049258 TaxID=3155394 RepID=UPI003446468F
MAAPLSPPPGPTRTARLAAYDVVSAALSRLDVRRLEKLLAGAAPVGGDGRATRMEVDGLPVLVRRVPLTDPELLAGNVLSTADLFGLPEACHYGVDSPGSGAWRELAAHSTATDWVLMDQAQGFPLLYHWRVLPDQDAPDLLDPGEAERMLDRWAGAPGVRARVEQLGRASHSVLLFLEHIPLTLPQWLADRTAEGGAAAESAWAAAQQGLDAATAFLRAQGLVRFDAGPDHLGTDGHRLYLTGFGLALHERFALSPQEARFLREHLDHDRACAAARLVRCAELTAPEARPGAATAVLDRYAAVAAVLEDFHRRLRQEGPQAPYPAEELRRALAGPGSGSAP